MNKKMIFFKTNIFESILFKPKKFSDERGFFSETWNDKQFNSILGKKINFVQDNFSRSKKNIIRGLHYQVKKPQDKLVRVSNGSVYDVIVDLRFSSPTFKNWFGVKLSSYNRNILWVPPGCAHGFVVLTNSADFLYKTTEYWFPEYEKCILWNDETLNINWFIKGKPILAEKDKIGTSLEKAEFYK